MIVALEVRAKVAAIARRVTVGHAKGHRAVTDRISPGRVKVSAKGHRAVTDRISPARIKASAKGHRAVTDRISPGRIKVIGPIAPKASAKGHDQCAISSLAHRVAKVSAQ